MFGYFPYLIDEEDWCRMDGNWSRDISYVCTYTSVYAVLPKLEARVSESKFELTGLYSCPL